MSFRDHADAMRVIGATFAGHALFEQPCQSWMVRRVMVPETGEPLPPATTDIITSSAYHFVVTWIPGRALIVSGDIGSATYSGITHLASLEETVRLMREADFDYLSRKSTHAKEFDGRRTAELIVENAYYQMRDSLDLESLSKRKTSLMDRIVDWHDGDIHGSPCCEHSAADRKAACRALIEDGADHDTLIHVAGDWEAGCTSWPSQAHWHYEALRTWGHLMARQMGEAKMRAARDAAIAQAAILAERGGKS